MRQSMRLVDSVVSALCRHSSSIAWNLLHRGVTNDVHPHHRRSSRVGRSSCVAGWSPPMLYTHSSVVHLSSLWRPHPATARSREVAKPVWRRCCWAHIPESTGEMGAAKKWVSMWMFMCKCLCDVQTEQLRQTASAIWIPTATHRCWNMEVGGDGKRCQENGNSWDKERFLIQRVFAKKP